MAETEKRDKRLANRRLRVAVHAQLGQGEETVLQLRDVSDTYTMDKDGKSRFDPAVHKKLMRK